MPKSDFLRGVRLHWGLAYFVISQTELYKKGTFYKKGDPVDRISYRIKLCEFRINLIATKIIK